MLGYYYISFVFALVVINAEGEGLEKCMELFNEGMESGDCCLDLEGFPGIYSPECNDLKSPCEMISCSYRKIGVKIEDNKIDEASYLIATRNLMKDYPQINDMNERTEKFCMDGQYKKYGLPDTCDAIKLHICISIYSMSVCNKWKKDDNCQKIQLDAKECKKTFDGFSK